MVEFDEVCPKCGNSFCGVCVDYQDECIACTSEKNKILESENNQLQVDFKKAGQEIDQLKIQLGEQHGRMSTMADEILELKTKLKIADMRFEKIGIETIDAWIDLFENRDDAILFLKHTMKNKLSSYP